MLKDDSIDINLQDEDGETALMGACYQGNLEIVQELLKRKELEINPRNDEDESAKIFALKKRNFEIVKLLDLHESQS